MAFDAFDHDKKGCISTDMVGTILGMLGHEISTEELAEIIAEIDVWGKCHIFLLITQHNHFTLNNNDNACYIKINLNLL